MPRKNATKGEVKVDKVMHEFKEGTLKSSTGGTVKARKQAIAIALSEARAGGAKIPGKAAHKTASKRSSKKT